MKMRLFAFLIGTLSGCASYQTGKQTIEMAESIARIRETQVLRNLSAALNNRSAVPSQITLTVGQANVTNGLGASAYAGSINRAITPIDITISPTASFTTQWQFSSVTDQDDLRLLRNIYALIVATDEQFDELTRYFNPSKLTNTPENAKAKDANVYNGIFGEFLPEDQALRTKTAISSSSHVIPWSKARQYLEMGDSIDCRMYQLKFVKNGKGFPFRRWLYWRRPQEKYWHPQNSSGESIQDNRMTSLGIYNGWELGVVTEGRGCFDDFVILVQGFTPVANAVSSTGTKIMLPTR